MAKITLKEPDGPYHCEIDTDVMKVEVRESYLGFRFIADSGEELVVSMRDGGFELHYTGKFETSKLLNPEWIDLKGGELYVQRKRL